VLAAAWSINIHFDPRLRDLFLLFFFSTIGLGSKLNTLARGGRAAAGDKFFIRVRLFLFDSYAFRQVTWLVHISAFENGYMIGE